MTRRPLQPHEISSQERADQRRDTVALVLAIVVACIVALALLLSGCTSEDRSTSARTAANVVQTVGDAGGAVLLACEITENHLAAMPRDQIDEAQARKIMAACKAVNETRKAARLTHDLLLLALLEAEALDDQRLPSVAAWVEVLRLTDLAKTQAQEAGRAVLAARKEMAK